MNVYIYILIALLFFSIIDWESRKAAFICLILLSVFFVCFIGLRGNTGADTLNYANFFKYNTAIISGNYVEKGYAEYGFYYLSVLLKSLWNNVNFYFVSISFLTFIFLLKAIKTFAIFPILSICVYYARFLIFRDMNQIRAALAIAVVIYALKFLVEESKRKYIITVLFAMTLHISTIIVLPFVFLYKKNFTIWRVIMLLIFATIGGIVIGDFLKLILMSTENIIVLTYVGAKDLGLLNPVILFQVFFVLLLFLFEDKLQKQQYGYRIIRNAYLYSTLILLITSELGEIGGRLATIFATCEIFIIPSFIYIIRPRIVGYLLVTIIIVFVFYLNYSKMLLLPEIWNYNINL